MRVLVVDDQNINRYLLEKLMSGYGFDVVTAEDGVQALERVRNEPFNLIISDILLPRMDGFQFCKAIKTDPKYQHIPFVFYSAAYTDQKDSEFASQLGADRFIIKPTDPAAFISIIRELFAEDHSLTEIVPKPMMLKEEEYLSEHNRSLFNQLEKKMAELEEMNRTLRQSEEMYKNLFDNAHDIIVLNSVSPTGESGRIIEVNSFAYQTLEYSHDELLGMNMSDIRTDEFNKRFLELFPLLLTSGDLTFEGELISRSGKKIPTEINTHLYREKETFFCLSICRDITRRREVMVELSRAINQINENIYQMATIGDEIRNPLAIILSGCEEYQDNGCQEIIKTAVKQIDEFISRIDKGWVESEKVKGFLLKHYGILTSENKLT